MSETQKAERYEVRLIRIEDGHEDVVETREVPLEKVREQQKGMAELPNREAMSLVNANVFAPINLAAAVNLLSDSSTAGAFADQYAPGTQTA